MNSIKDQKNLNKKKVLLRLDLNVPLKKGLIADETRINKIIPILNFLIKENNYYKGNKVSREVYFHQKIINNTPIEEDVVIIHCHPKNIISLEDMEL